MLAPLIYHALNQATTNVVQTTQDALVASTKTSYNVRATQAALTASATTSYKVRVTQDILGASVWTAYTIRTTQTPLVVWVLRCDSTSYVPPAPTGVVTLTATAEAPNTGKVDLSWTTIPGFAFAIYQGTTPGGEGGTPIITGIDSGSYVVSELTFHTTYYWYVVGTNACGDATTSNEAHATPECVTPDPPLNLSAALGPFAHDVTLTWAEVVGATYDVYRSLTPGAEILLASDLSSTSYIDTSAPIGDVYYKVSATTFCGESGLSQELLFVVPCCIPWTPQGPPSQTWGAGSSCTATWTASTPPGQAWSKEGC